MQLESSSTTSEGPESPATFHRALKERAPVLAWLSLSCLSGAFRASSTTRQLLSALLCVHLSFTVHENVAPTTKAVGNEALLARLHVHRLRVRLAKAIAGRPLRIHIRVPVRDLPFRRVTVNRALVHLVPMVKWEDCNHVRFVCRGAGDVDAIDRQLWNGVLSLPEADAGMFTEERSSFRNLVRLTLSSSQLMDLPDDLVLTQVRRVKVICRESALADLALLRFATLFPGLVRLHLLVIPAVLPKLCGPGVCAPVDLRLSHLEDPGHARDGHKAQLFVASHLMSLPFSWSGGLFHNVQRLQMAELNQDLLGLTLEKLVATLRALPALRRLGTVSLRTALLFDIVREDFQLEELVLVLDLLDVPRFFRSLLPLETQRRRTSLRRLAVHLLAPDGAPMQPIAVENANCAGWYNLAAFMLRPQGFITFSLGSRQLIESAPMQLPWFHPAHFSLDQVEYAEGCAPASTPIELQLPYYNVDTASRPRGTLVSGPLRPSSEAEQKAAAAEAEAAATPSSPPFSSSRRSFLDLGSTQGSTGLSLTPLAKSRRQLRSRAGDSERPAFMSILMKDAVETLEAVR